MRDPSQGDHLELWRGIDDAIWREAARATQAARAKVPAAAPVVAPAPAPRAPAVPRRTLVETV